MELVVRALLFIAMGCVVVAANIWFIRLSMNAFSPHNLPTTIAPVTIAGMDDKDGRNGQILAALLLGQLGRIRVETMETLDQLQSFPDSRGLPDQKTNRIQVATISEPRISSPILVPTSVLEQAKIEMKIGGVEVGGLLSWLQHATTRENVLRLAVENLSGRAVVSGSWSEGRETFWSEVTGDPGKLLSNEQIAKSAAYALVQKQLSASVVEVGALTTSEFQQLLATLAATADLNRQIALGRAAESEFAALFDRIKPVVAKTPRWRELILLSAMLAERGSFDEQALALYQEVLPLIAANAPLRADILAHISELMQHELALASAQSASHAIQEGRVDPTHEWPLSALGLADLNMSKPVRIGVLGGALSTAARRGLNVEVIERTGIASTSDASSSDYWVAVVRTILSVAPKAQIVLSDGGELTFSDTELLKQLDSMLLQHPQVLLITLGPLRGPVWVAAMQRVAAQGTVIVVAAGNNENEPAQFAETNLKNEVLVAGAINKDGRASKFTSQGEHVVWAPGEQIPVHVGEAGLKLMSGTSFSAALSAGIVARLIAERPGTAAGTLVDTLRSSATPSAAGGKPAINLAAALSKLPATTNH